jgi:Cu/Ag efflux protein CusF
MNSVNLVHNLGGDVKHIILAATLVIVLGGTAAAQTKTITGDVKMTTATVESIERSTREVTLKKENGEFVTTTVPPDMKRFDTLKIGDKISVKYYDNIVLRVKLPGEKDVDTSAASATPAAGTTPAGTKARQRTITATITEIDPKVPSITFKGPNNWTYSSRVLDTDALKKVKVGDKVDITWTEALLISLESPK